LSKNDYNPGDTEINSIFRRLKAGKDKINLEMFSKFSMTPEMYSRYQRGLVYQDSYSFEDSKEKLNLKTSNNSFQTEKTTEKKKKLILSKFE
jgi:hypothetical protein